MPAAGISQQKGPNSSPGQPTLQKLNKLATKFCLICHVYLTNHHFFKHLNSFLQGKCFHNQQEAENAFQEFVESWSTDIHATGINKHFSLAKMCWLKNKIKFKNVLIITVPILISKDILACVLSCFSRVWLFEPSYMYLKFMVQNRNYICTNLIIVCIC